MFWTILFLMLLTVVYIFIISPYSIRKELEKRIGKAGGVGGVGGETIMKNLSN